MVIDLTRKPVVVNTDICVNWVVLRTAGNHEVDGRVRRSLEKKENRRGLPEHDVMVVEVGAMRKRDDRTLMEVRLPLNHIARRRPEQPIPNPFEVATVYTDAFTKMMSTWRAQIIVERVANKNGTLWLITVRDETSKQFLLTATAKDLDASHGGVIIMTGVKLPDEQFPLDRLSPSALGPTPPLSVWDRLRQIEYDPNPGLDDEES